MSKASLKFRQMPSVALPSSTQLCHYRRPLGWAGKTRPWCSCAVYSISPLYIIMPLNTHWNKFHPQFFLADLYLCPKVKENLFKKTTLNKQQRGQALIWPFPPFTALDFFGMCFSVTSTSECYFFSLLHIIFFSSPQI